MLRENFPIKCVCQIRYSLRAYVLARVMEQSLIWYDLTWFSFLSYRCHVGCPSGIPRESKESVPHRFSHVFLVKKERVCVDTWILVDKKNKNKKGREKKRGKNKKEVMKRLQLGLYGKRPTAQAQATPVSFSPHLTRARIEPNANSRSPAEP